MFSPTTSTKITIHQNSDKPRYIHSNFGVLPNSPSKVSNVFDSITYFNTERIKFILIFRD